MTSARPLFNNSKKQCYYKMLQVSHTASAVDIKASYRKLALQLHPDQHSGCTDKQAAFQNLQQAYQVLMDPTERATYDRSQGYHHHRTFNTSKRHRPGVNPNYRKVYAPRPPPEWNNVVCDHQAHYDMHYGDGMQRVALREALRTTSRAALEYQSPLGRGFSFSSTREDDDDDDDDDDSSSSRSKQKFAPNTNPYSKRSPQGPPRITIEYEEADNLGSTNGGRTTVTTRRERIIHDLYQRRSERVQQRHEQQQPDYHDTPYSRFQEPYAAASMAAAPQGECVIL